MIDKFSHGFINSVYEFNDFTLNELICKLAQKMDEVITQSNESFNYLDWLKNEGLSDEVIGILQAWKDDGTLETLINEQLFNGLNTKIDENKAKLDEISSQLDTNTKFKGVTLNAIELGCDNTGAIGCSDIVQAKINEGYSIMFPKGIFKCNITMKPKITIEGSGIGVTNIIPEDINTNVINADKSCYEYTIKNLSIDGKNEMGKGNSNIKGIYLSNVGELAQQDLEPHIENIKIVNTKVGLQVDEGIRGGLFKNIKSGACVIGINHLSTDCIFTDCVTAQTQKHGYFILKSNNTFVNCKAFIAGLGKIEGAGFKLQGSYNRLINCESQQNVFESLHLQNANSNIIQGCILDGSGYNSKTWFPNLTYNETGGTVPISILRIYNSNSNMIDCNIINGRIDSYSKCGLYNQYVGNDSNNDIRMTIVDTDTADTKPFVNYILDNDNKYFKNNNIVINGTLMQNKTWIQPSIIDNNVEITKGGYIVKNGICYLNMEVKGLNTYTWVTEILTGLPRPLMDNLQLATNMTDRVIKIENDKIIVGTGLTTDTVYRFSATYLIK